MIARLARTALLGVIALAAVAGCSGGGSDPVAPPPPTNAKFVGLWRLPEVGGEAGAGFDVLFNADGSFFIYEMQGTAAKTTGTYAVDANGQCTGSWQATRTSREGLIRAHLENGDTILAFTFIETNAYDNPHANNGYIEAEYRGGRAP